MSWAFKPIGKDKLVVITTIFNPVKYSSRYHLYRRFERHVQREGVRLVTVELTYRDRPFEITQMGNSDNIQLTTDDEIWQKERALNVGLWRLLHELPQTEYVLFADADIEFVYENWAEKIIQSLQHYDVIQPWSTCIDLGPNDEALKIERSFLRNYWHKTPERKANGNCYYYGKHFWGHPGYAWAWRVDALRAVGSLIDFAVAGSADHHMAAGLIGEMHNTRPHKTSHIYKSMLSHWEERALKALRKNVGFIDGSIKHYWHGRKSQRGYVSRWDILLKNNYNPLTDIFVDEQGLYKLNPESTGLRDDLRRYFRQRNEDSKEQ